MNNTDTPTPPADLLREIVSCPFASPNVIREGIRIGEAGRVDPALIEKAQAKLAAALDRQPLPRRVA